MTASLTPKPWIAAIHTYVPGKSAGADGRPLVKLSANENPLGCSPKALAARADAVHPALYPDGDSTALRTAIGQMHGIEPNRVIMGSGSGELLYLAASAYAGPGDEVLFSQYSFSLYDIVARRCGAEPVEAKAKDYGTNVDAMLAAVTPPAGAVSAEGAATGGAWASEVLSGGFVSSGCPASDAEWSAVAVWVAGAGSARGSGGGAGGNAAWRTAAG